MAVGIWIKIESFSFNNVYLKTYAKFQVPIPTTIFFLSKFISMKKLYCSNLIIGHEKSSQILQMPHKQSCHDICKILQAIAL